MCRALCVLALVVTCVGVAHCWDIAVSVGNEIIFYTDGTRTNTVHIESRNITGLAYVKAQNMILYVDKQDNNDAVCGYYLSSMKIKCFIKRNGRNIHSLAYEPRTEILFFTDTNEKSINWISLTRGFDNNINGNLLIKLDDGTPADIIVDSCKGNIYWSNANITVNRCLEGARFDGSKREVIVDFYPVYSLAMDYKKHEIYYIDGCKTCPTRYINRFYFGADYDIVTTLYYNPVSFPNELTISKDYIYWTTSNGNQKTVWQLPKNADSSSGVSPTQFDGFNTDQSLGIVANYEENEGIKSSPDCESLTNLMPTMAVTPDYTGNCSVNEKGLLRCSDNNSNTEEERKVSVCHGYCLNNGDCSLNKNSAPVCQCKGNYTGDRCEVSRCLNYCQQGNCSFNNEGYPTCSCNPGYIGDRCEISVCYSYCLNNGNCSLNETSDPICQCKGHYSGDRCEVSDCLNYCLQGHCSFNDERHPTCSCNAGFTGDRCEVSVCHGYCLNDGVCTLNEEDEAVCECVGDHEGSRCEVDKNNSCTVTNTPTYYSAQKNLTLTDLLSNGRKPTVKISVNVEI